jgi:phosphatidylserine/phosphatidylglycerophosphate/cardiolipin synthase-like enzyme
MTPSAFPASFIQPWRELLKSTQGEQIDDFPNYHVFNPEALVSTSVPTEFLVGTGFSIFSRTLLPAMLEASHSIHFVTCYWAESPSLDAFKATLEQLATLRKQQGSSQPLRITIGFSSHGLLQKLFHTASRDGHIYPPSQWGKLGLPDEALLREARIDMTVKSLFFTPFSVMHPKYLLVDDQKAWIPSCNVSWERWFEGCIAVEGDIVAKILMFHEKVWGLGAWADFANDQNEAQPEPPRPSHTKAHLPSDSDEHSATRSCTFREQQPVPTVFLPSPHHRDPRLGFFPLLSQQKPPITPLNAALLTLFANAQQQITILTPNVTSWPALDALLAALSRGVDVQIRTSKNMMLLEQLVTAGTWTSRCLNQFIKKYEALKIHARNRGDLERASVVPGHLDIFLYKENDDRAGEADEPVLSHIKATMVDGQYLVLGSGNMDRASWWTSQEIGLLFHMPDFDGASIWESVLKTRSEVLYTSTRG